MTVDYKFILWMSQYYILNEDYKLQREGKTVFSLSFKTSKYTESLEIEYYKTSGTESFEPDSVGFELTLLKKPKDLRFMGGPHQARSFFDYMVDKTQLTGIHSDDPFASSIYVSIDEKTISTDKPKSFKAKDSFYIHYGNEIGNHAELIVEWLTNRPWPQKGDTYFTVIPYVAPSHPSIILKFQVVSRTYDPDVSVSQKIIKDRGQADLLALELQRRALPINKILTSSEQP